jgi:hypothetical protein
MRRGSTLVRWCARAVSRRRLTERREGAGRTAMAVEPLEGRLFLSAGPVLVYNFDEGGGAFVHDTAPDGSPNDGTLLDDGGFMPEFRFGDTPDGSSSYLHFGYEGSEYDYASGGRVETAQPLHPILGASGTIAFYVRSFQFGQGYAWLSPGVTGSDHRGDGNDVMYGNLNQAGQIRAVAGDGAEAATPDQVIYNGWHHVVHTRDAASGTIRTYFDGRLVASAAGDVGVKAAAFNSIGANTVHPFNSLTDVEQYYYFNGDLDQVEIYDYAMDPRDVATRYGAEFGVPQVPQVVADNDIIGTARLQWPDTGESTGYAVERRTATTDWAVIAFLPVQGYPTYAQNFKDTNLEVGTTYSYRVTAFNGSGSATSPVMDVVPKATGNGVVAHYWDSDFWGSDNRTGDTFGGWYLNTLSDQSVAVGHNVDYIWDNDAPADPFSGELSADLFSTAFTGKVRADETGYYWFMGRSDDDGILYVNGQIVSSDPFGHGLRDASTVAPVYLEAGHDYDFLFMQAEQGGAAALQMNWMKPSFEFTGQWWERVPVDYLVAHDDAPAAPTNLQAGWDGGKYLFQFTDNATNEWGYVLERRAEGGGFEPVDKGAIAGFDPFLYNDVVTPTFTDMAVPLDARYEYRVRAYNAEGSSVSNVLTLFGSGGFQALPGAHAFYIDQAAWGAGALPGPGVLPTVTPVAEVIETVPNVNFDYGFGTPNDPGGMLHSDSFSTVFTGTLRSAEAGTYQIYLESDDAGYLLVNGQVVSADPGTHGTRDPRSVGGGLQRVFPITLEADTDYNFVALQADRFNNAGIVMKWVRPDQSEPEVVPDAQFVSNFPTAAGGTAAGAPVAPGNLRVTNADSGATFLTLRWEDRSTNELRFVLERSTAPTFADSTVVMMPINSTSYTDFGLSPATRYYYRLNAANFFGEASTTLDVTTLAQERPPAAPADLRASARTAGVKLGFRDGSNNEDEFVIERADAGSATFAVLGRVGGSPRGATGGTFSFTDATAVAGRDYTYRVYASNDGGTSAPSAPVTVRAGSAGGTGADATFYNDQFFTGSRVTASAQPADRLYHGGAPVEGIDPETYSAVFHAELLAEFNEPYTFYTASDDGIEVSLYDHDTGELLLNGPTGGIRFQRPMPLTGFQETVGTVNLTAGRRYLLEWRFSQGNGEAGYRLGWSSPSLRQEVLPTELLFPVERSTVPLQPVEGLAASAFGIESVSVRWTERNFGETGFRVDRKLASESDAAFDALGVAGADATSFSDTSGVQFGVTYVYRVTAARGDESGPSRTTSVTPGSFGGFTYNGAAVFQPGPDGDAEHTADNAVLLTSNQFGVDTGSAFSNNAVRIVSPAVPSLFGETAVRGFNVRFDLLYTGGFPTSNEGIGFVIQRNDPTAVGRGGYESGYGGVTNSFAVLFQPAYQTTFPFVNGAALPYGPQDLPFPFGYEFGTRVEIEYDADAQLITERLGRLDEFGQVLDTFTRQYFTVLALTENGYEELPPTDLAAMMGGDYGFFGFTGAGPQLEQVVSNFRVNGAVVPFLPEGVEPSPPPPNSPPTAHAGGEYFIIEGDDLALDASGSRDLDGDALSYSWDVNGDGVFGDATGVRPRLAWAQLQALGLDDGDVTVPVSVQVSDGVFGPITASTTLHLGNREPRGVFSGPATVAEGGAAAFEFTNVSDHSAADQAAGFTYMYFVDRDRDGQITEDERVVGETGPGFTTTFDDDGVYNIRALISDKDGGTAEYRFDVTVTNADPVVGAVVGPAGPRLVNSDVTISTSFTDAGAGDRHTAVWDWGDGATTTDAVTPGSIARTHQYAAPGLYTVRVTVTDDDGGTSTSSYQYVVVYDPAAGNASGSGWVQTPGGKAEFGFDVRYARGATTPGGNLTFTLPGMSFKATSFDWMVVKRGGTTYIRGHGMVNRAGGYSFLLAVSDGRATATADRLRMKVWSDATGAAAFDTQTGDPEDAAPVLDIGGGNILLP